MRSKNEFLQAVGEELAEARVTHRDQLTLQSVANVMGWGRSAISKIEIGTPEPEGIRRINISLYDYLRLIELYRDSMPNDHPAVALLDHFAPKRGRTR